MAENKMGQPQGLHSSQSFSRLQPSGLHALGRSRASTLQHGFSSGKTSSEAVIISQNSAKSVRPGDIFEQNTSGLSLAKSQKEPAGSSILEDVPEGFDELPIELVSLTDRYGS